MKIIFLGTPLFAIEPLKKIINTNHKIIAIVSQPDKKNKRGNKVVFSPVKDFAIKNNINLYQYNKIREEGLEELKSMNADIMVTCAYGQILSNELLSMTKFGVINIHSSLLPKYRGSSPVQWAIINGENEIGITIMKTALSLDSGDIILQKSMSLNGNENTSEALEKLSFLGADLIVKALDLIETGKAKYIRQNENEMTYYPMLKKNDGEIDFSKSALEIKNFIRGMNPWPCAFIKTDRGILKILEATVIDNDKTNKDIGNIEIANPKEGLIVRCGKGSICLKKVQGENSKVMNISDYLRGKPMQEGKNICQKN